MGRLSRWSLLVFLVPSQYVTPSYFDPPLPAFDFERWSSDIYEWRREGWTPWQDTSQKPRETVVTASGDCDDYALAAASWALARDRSGVGLAVLGHYAAGVVPRPTHMVAYDDERVYSSGEIIEGTPREFIADRDEYDWVLCNGVDR